MIATTGKFVNDGPAQTRGAITLLLLFAAGPIQALEGRIAAPAETSFLPLWGDRARELGYELPLPFGVGVGVIGMWQDYSIKSLALEIEGTKQTRATGLVVDNASGHDQSLTFRADVWLLPFLNVYGVMGYTEGKTVAPVNVPALNLTFDFPLDYSGPTYGGGATLVGGYKSLFAMLDYNYTETDLDISSRNAVAHVLTPRAGWQGRMGGFKGALWTGAMYQGVAQRFVGRLKLSGLTIGYDVDQEPVAPWNLLIGGQWNITTRFDLIVEGGLGERKQIFSALTYRF